LSKCVHVYVDTVKPASTDILNYRPHAVSNQLKTFPTGFKKSW